MDLGWELYITEVEDMVDVEVVVMDWKAKDCMQKKANAKVANPEYSIPMKELMSRTDNSETLMNHWELRFETIKRLVLEIYDATFLNNASVPNKERTDVQ